MYNESTKMGSRGAWALLAVLFFANVLAYIDRQVLNLLVQQIKGDLHISDSKMSVLQGLSFAVFMCLAGIPVGRLVDTHRRTAVLAIGIMLWSFATAASAFAESYFALLLCRICVGVGEAVAAPAGFSLISDRFPKERHGLALGIFIIGVFMGTGLAMLLGGTAMHVLPAEVTLPVLGVFRGWQVVFLVLLIPGLLVAALVAWQHEPPRGKGVEPPTKREATRWLRARITGLIPLYLAGSFQTMSMHALMAWTPTFYRRHFDLPSMEIGYSLALIVIIAGIAGSVTSGLTGDWLAGRRHYGRILVWLMGTAFAIPCVFASLQAATASESLTFFAPAFFFLTFTLAATPSLLVQLTPPRMRGLHTAILQLVINIIAIGLGPTAVALVTDYVLQDETRVGTALAITVPVMLTISLIMTLIAIKPYQRMVSDEIPDHAPAELAPAV